MNKKINKFYNVMISFYNNIVVKSSNKIYYDIEIVLLKQIKHILLNTPENEKYKCNCTNNCNVFFDENYENYEKLLNDKFLCDKFVLYDYIKNIIEHYTELLEDQYQPITDGSIIRMAESDPDIANKDLIRVKIQLVEMVKSGEIKPALGGR